MKAVPGLIVALILGGAAIVFNWIYLEKKASEFETVLFLGIGDGQTVPLGEKLTKDHFTAVPVPKSYADKLKKFVYLYEDLSTVTGIKATREYKTGDLVHREDYRTPATTIPLNDDQRLIWVTVDTRAFVPSLVNPGDQLDFVFPGAGELVRPELGGSELGRPELGGSELGRPQVGGPPVGGGTAETLGPFTVGALGTRLGDVDVARGHSSGRAEERQIGLIVDLVSGELNAEALRLLELTTGSNRSVAVALHPRVERD